MSEYPHAAVVAAFVWWMDRIKLQRPLIGATTRQLVVLGLLAAAAFNVRRESIVLVAVVLVVQIVELVAARRGRPRVPVAWRTVAAPHATFVGAVIGFQLLLPSMLFPDTGDGPRYVPDRISDYAGVLTEHLGLAKHPVVGTVILLLAVAGMVVGCIRRPRLDIPLTALTVLSTIAVSTHFRMVGRYYFQVAPFVLYFAAAAVIAAAAALLPRAAIIGRHRRSPRSRWRFCSSSTSPCCRATSPTARDFDRAGRVQIGPADPRVTPIFDAVEAHTAPTEVVAYFRARTMTLYTDRLAIQTTNIDRIMQRADWFAQQRGSSYYQPDLDRAEAEALGLEEVWSDARWILWRVPEPTVVSE